ncbi:hypothetical protein [Capnocytophaga gingivalis]|uniref:Lipoprotein n=1 Tax=Capnocytophaga gingivalis TaxID=1017 RepID=A0ABU5Z6H1_9FLAO|nr:hypothetical protein [Capnocytophaga gingivalis]MEB3074534.1 hypothetical protein [Capnocytophaga gingivalis]
MKRNIHALCTAICALFTVVSCSKSDDNNQNNNQGGIVNNTFSSEVTKVVSQDLIKKMADGGATIYGGTNPPAVEGYFTTGALELIHSSFGIDKDPLRGRFDGFFYKFYGKSGSNIKIDYRNHSGGDYRAQGVNAVISGEGDKFTIFFINKAGDLHAISGTFTGDAIEGFQETDYVKVGTNTSPVGTVRVLKSKDGRAEKIQGF